MRTHLLAISLVLSTLAYADPAPSGAPAERPMTPAESAQAIDLIRLLTVYNARFATCTRLCSDDFYATQHAMPPASEPQWVHRFDACAASCDIPETACSHGDKAVLVKRATALTNEACRSALLRELQPSPRVKLSEPPSLDVIAQELEDCEQRERRPATAAGASADALYQGGVALDVAGKRSEAKKALAEAIALDPSMAIGRLRLAVVADALGDTKRAAEQAAAYLKLRPCGGEQILAKKLAARTDPSASTSPTAPAPAARAP